MRPAQAPLRSRRRRGAGRFGAVLASALLLATAPLLPMRSDASGTTTIVTTFGGWTGAHAIGYFGKPTWNYSHIPTLGQTITPAADSVLDRFVFLVKFDPSIRFTGHIYRWDSVARRATGAPVWSGGPHRTTVNDWQRLVLLPRVRLTAGRQYVVFLSTVGMPQPISPQGSSFALLGDQGRNPYKGGAFVYDHMSTSASGWTTTQWDGGSGDYLVPGEDLVFRADFTT